MGMRLTVPGTIFSRYVDIVKYPITSQLTSLFLLGTDAASSKSNHGSGADATSGGGSITYASGYARFGGLNTNIDSYLQTTDLDNASDDMTLIALVQREDSGNRIIYGSYNGITDGASLEAAAAYVANGALIGGAYAKARPDDKFYFQAMTISGSTVIPYTGIGGELVAGTPVSATRTKSANGARIGGGYANGSWAGALKISAVAKHTRALTTAELAEVYAYLKSRAVKLGLSVS